MKKMISWTVVSGLLLICSCAKNPAQNPGGSWTFEHNAYNVSTCIGSSTSGNLIANGSSSVSPGTLTINFFTYPSTNGTFVDTVSSGAYPSQANRVGIIGTVGNTAQQTNYLSTGGNGIETVFVTVTNGKINITGSGLMLKNTGGADPADSAALELNVTQLQ